MSVTSIHYTYILPILQRFIMGNEGLILKVLVQEHNKKFHLIPNRNYPATFIGY